MSDGLTGIANRRCFDQRLAADWARLADEGRPLALLLVDADCFKPLNDACGHLYGDECLRELARMCTPFADREEDLVARYGGEELVLLLPGRDGKAAHDIGERLRRQVEIAGMAHPDSCVAPHVTVSVGVSVVPPGSRSPEQLIGAADRALYAAKAGGRNRVAGGNRMVVVAGIAGRGGRVHSSGGHTHARQVYRYSTKYSEVRQHPRDDRHARRWRVRLRLAPPRVNLYVKVEAFNPMGSVKDRLALGVIEDAERSGALQPGPDRDRGDQRQHRHRPGDGVRAEGLSAGRRRWPRTSASSAAS